MNSLCDLHTGDGTKIPFNAQKIHRNICCFSTNVIQILNYIHLNVFEMFIMLLHPYTDCWTCICKSQCTSVRVFMRLPATAWRFCWLIHCIFIFHRDVSRCATDTLAKACLRCDAQEKSFHCRTPCSHAQMEASIRTFTTFQPIKTKPQLAVSCTLIHWAGDCEASQPGGWGRSEELQWALQ